MSWTRVPRESSVDSRDTAPVCSHPSSLSSDAELSSISSLPSTMLRHAQDLWKTLLSGNQKSTLSPPPARPISLNTANSRDNKPWGDELDEKQVGHLRLYAVNLNGIPLDARGGQFDITCRILKEIQADVFCGQEHNLDTSQEPIRKILFDTASQHWERNRLTIGTTPIPFKSMFKPGGTLILTVGSTTGRVVKQVRDKWGRWACQEFQGRESQRLVIISAYQPIDSGAKAGKITVAAQHRSLLLRSDDNVQNPRTAFRRDLSLCIADYSNKHFEILLVGDFNEPFGADPDGLTKIAGTFKLIDLMSSRHSSSPPATYARGSKRIDYALGTARFHTSLKRSGYEPFNSRIPSDHRGYFLDFDTATLFGSATQDLAMRANRGLSASNKVQVSAYIRRKYELLQQCNAFERAIQLGNPGNRHAFAERLDRDVLTASLSAEADLPKFDEPAWSVELAHARRKVILLSKMLSVFKTGLDHQTIRQQALEDFAPSFVFPTSPTECSTQLRQAKQDVKQLVSVSIERRDAERNRRIKALEASTTQSDRRAAQQLRRLKKAEDLKNLFSETQVRANQRSANWSDTIRNPSTRRRRSKNVFRLGPSGRTVRSSPAAATKKSNSLWSSTRNSIHCFSPGNRSWVCGRYGQR